MADLESTFNRFAAHGKTGDKSQIKGMDNKNWSKLCKDCKILDGKIIQGNDVDIVFSKVKSKGARVITFDQFLIALKELADKKYKKESDEDTRTNRIYELVRGGSVQNTGVTKTSKTGGVAKMTDTSQYTGSHKERFDASGKGKGITGREDLAENSGYVGNYKGAGTYDDKVSK